MAEKPSIFVMRRGPFLAPMTPADASALDKLPIGKALRVDVRQPRSVPHHRLYWSMLALVCDNLDGLTTEALHGLIKLRTGYAVEIRTKRGVERVPGSIAFDKMDQGEFRAFFDKAIAFVNAEIIPGIGSLELEREARLMLGEVAA